METIIFWEAPDWLSLYFAIILVVGKIYEYPMVFKIWYAGLLVSLGMVMM